MREQIGKYNCICRIGMGSMGEVYLAQDSILHKKCAIKIVESKDPSDHRVVALYSEAERMKNLTDRRIPYLIDFIRTTEFYALIMEYVEGINVATYLENKAPLEEKEAMELFRQMTSIVAYLHQRQPSIIYRDLKPSNFMLNEQGEIRLLDFGTALQGYGTLEETVSYGTYGYCAPEQRMQRSVTKAVDVYSLGAILYYMVTGIDPSKPPYEVLQIDSVSPLASKTVSSLIEKCCSNNPEMRYQDADILLTTIDKERTQKSKSERLLVIGWITYYILLLCTLLLGLKNLLCLLRQELIEWKQLIVFGIMLGICCITKMLLKESHKRKNFIIKREWNLVYTEKTTIGLW